MTLSFWKVTSEEKDIFTIKHDFSCRKDDH